MCVDGQHQVASLQILRSLIVFSQLLLQIRIFGCAQGCPQRADPQPGQYGRQLQAPRAEIGRQPQQGEHPDEGLDAEQHVAAAVHAVGRNHFSVFHQQHHQYREQRTDQQGPMRHRLPAPGSQKDHRAEDRDTECQQCTSQQFIEVVGQQEADRAGTAQAVGQISAGGNRRAFAGQQESGGQQQCRRESQRLRQDLPAQHQQQTLALEIPVQAHQRRRQHADARHQHREKMGVKRQHRDQRHTQHRTQRPVAFLAQPVASHPQGRAYAYAVAIETHVKGVVIGEWQGQPGPGPGIAGDGAQRVTGTQWYGNDRKHLADGLGPPGPEQLQQAHQHEMKGPGRVESLGESDPAGEFRRR